VALKPFTGVRSFMGTRLVQNDARGSPPWTKVL
jgi:hypothetical protein